MINDLIARGYLFGHLKGRLPASAILILTMLVYAFDDAWAEGISWENTVFSLSLGLSLAVAFWRTGAIWANTGIHWGLNMMYAVVYGIPGMESMGGILQTKELDTGSESFWILLGITALMAVTVHYAFPQKPVSE